jgi:hypothetical protein
MEENERLLWWKVVSKCWAQNPLARISMEEASKILSELQKKIFERIQGEFLILFVNLFSRA